MVGPRRPEFGKHGGDDFGDVNEHKGDGMPKHTESQSSGARVRDRRWVRKPDHMDTALAQVYRMTAPMVKHLAAFRDVDHTQVSREMSGERASVFAKVQEIIYRTASDPRGNPFPLLIHWMAGCGARMRTPTGRTALQDYQDGSRQEALVQGAADAEQAVSLYNPTRASLEAARARLVEHGAEIMELLADLERAIQEVDRARRVQ